MASRRTPAEQPAVEATKTVSGYAIQILAFIPIGKKDLKKQAAIPTLFMQIEEGDKTVADLAPYLTGIEFKQAYVNKRFPESEAEAMLNPPAPAVEQTEEHEQAEE